MHAIRPVPKELEKVLGEEGTRNFIVFLNETFEDQKKNIVETVNDIFHRHVTEEVSRVRLEVAELRTDMAGLRSEIKTDMANLRVEMGEIRTELKSDIASLRSDMGEIRSEMKSDLVNVYKAIADLQKTMAGQTRWLLVLLLGGAVIYPISIKLIDRLFPEPPPTVIMPDKIVK